MCLQAHGLLSDDVAARGPQIWTQAYCYCFYCPSNHCRYLTSGAVHFQWYFTAGDADPDELGDPHRL